jgi:hypothetical protein
MAQSSCAGPKDSTLVMTDAHHLRLIAATNMVRKSGIASRLCALVLAGCATTPISPTQASRVASDRLLAFQEVTPERTATIVVTRDEGFVGSGCYTSFLVNGLHAARLAPVVDSAQLDLTAGHETEKQNDGRVLARQ